MNGDRVMVVLDDVVREIFRLMKRMGAKDCTRYAPVNMPRIECIFEDNEVVVIALHKYKKVIQ